MACWRVTYRASSRVSSRWREVIGLAVRRVSWRNNQSNVFVGMVRAQRIEQTPGDDVSMPQ